MDGGLWGAHRGELSLTLLTYDRYSRTDFSSSRRKTTSPVKLVKACRIRQMDARTFDVRQSNCFQLKSLNNLRQRLLDLFAHLSQSRLGNQQRVLRPVIAIE